jgi:hypothetical protein
MANKVQRLGAARLHGAGALAPPQDDHLAGNAAARGYGHKWRKARATILARQPLCVIAQMQGRVALADTIDHLYPHRGLRWLFWHRPYWVPVTKTWHDGEKQRLEARGEGALDELAIMLGIQPLSFEFPDAVHEWRAANTQQFRR